MCFLTSAYCLLARNWGNVLSTSVAQDLVHCMTCGHIKTAKPLSMDLAKTMKYTSESKQSRVAIEPIWPWPLSNESARDRKRNGTTTAWLEYHWRRCFMPLNIRLASLLQLCWDNNEILEETVTDAGTTQTSNCIVFQRQTHLATSEDLEQRSLLPHHLESWDVSGRLLSNLKSISNADLVKDKAHSQYLWTTIRLC